MKRLKRKRGKADKAACKKGHANAAILFENKILTNPLLTKFIFADITYSDLLNCSLVSKAWNLAFRSITVDRFRTYLTLSEKSTVEVLEDFTNLLSSVVPGHQTPVNGIQVKFEARIQEWPFSSGPFVDLINRIMEQMQVKCVSFDMEELKLKAAAFHNIFKALVIPHLGTIEFLEILNFDESGSLASLSQQLLRNSLPNLKEIDFDGSQNGLKTLTLKTILRACPNLKEFSFVFPYQLPALRITKKLHLASKVQFHYMKLTPKDFQLLVENSGLIKELKMYMGAEGSKKRLEGESIHRLQSVFSSQLRLNLEYVQLSYELLVAILLQNSFLPLPNLKELVCCSSQDWFCCLYKSGTTRFAQLLPNLKSLTIWWFPWESEWLEEKYENENEVGPFSLYQRSTSVSLDSVRELIICGSEDEVREKYEILTKLMDLDQAFPCVTYLQIGFWHSELEDLLKWICESWGDLLETLILCDTECSSLLDYAEDDDEPVRQVTDVVLDAIKNKRRPLPAGINYSDKLSRLQQLKVSFHHPVKWTFEPNYKQETAEVRSSFKPRDGQEVQVLISGCRAQKRMSRVKCGVSVYDTILALHLCPQDSELTPMEKIISTESVCKKICKMLPIEDLLNCSLVNRCWNVAARKELHQFRVCILSLDPIDHPEPRQKLIWLSQVGKQEFYNCLSAEISIFYECEDYQCSKIKADCRFLEDLDLKHQRFKTLKVSGPEAAEEEHRSNDFYDSDDDDDSDDDSHKDADGDSHKDADGDSHKDDDKGADKDPEEDGEEDAEEDPEEDADDDSDDGCEYKVYTLLETFFKTIVLKLDLNHVETLVTSVETWKRLFRVDFGNVLVPNLRSIKFVDPPKLIEYPEVIKRLFEELKFLERIDNPLTNKILAYIASIGKSSVVKHIEIYEFPDLLRFIDTREFISQREKNSEPRTLVVPQTALDFLLEFAECSPVLETISVGNHVMLSRTNEPLLRKVFQLICASSYESLHTLRLSLPLLWLVSLVYTRPLVTVQKITLWNDEGNFDPQHLLSQIPFSRMSPNLKELSFQRSLTLGPCTLNYNTLAKRYFKTTKVISRPQPCVSVSFLNLKLEMGGGKQLKSSSPAPWEIADVAALFPHATKLYFAFFGSTKIPGTELTKVLGSLWESWPKLESLMIDSGLGSDVCSFESWILGISGKEWSYWEEELRGDGERGELLSKMQYAPSTFSFRNCKDLNEFLINRETETVLIKRTRSFNWRRLCLFEPWKSEMDW